MTETGTPQKAKAGDREALASIIAEHGPRLAQLTTWYLDGRDVDDVLQDIWAPICRKRGYWASGPSDHVYPLAIEGIHPPPSGGRGLVL